MLFLKRHLIYKGCETKQKMIRGGKITIQMKRKMCIEKNPFNNFSCLKWLGQHFYTKFSILSEGDENACDPQLRIEGDFISSCWHRS